MTNRSRMAVSMAARIARQSHSFKRIPLLGIFALVPGSAVACPITDLVKNLSCAPEMSAEYQVSIPQVYDEGGFDPSYAVLKYNGGDSWKLDAVGPFEAVSNPVTYVPRYPAWNCDEEGLLYIPYIVMPSGEPVQRVVLRRDEVNLLVWHIVKGAAYPSGFPCGPG